MPPTSGNQAFYCGVQCVVLRRGRPRATRQVLLGLRYRTAGEGQWALPGGHVEWNESPFETACRELQEETSLVGQPAKIGSTFFTYSTEVPYAHVPVVFEDIEGPPRVIPDERFSQLQYFRLDDLPQPLFEPSRLALAEVTTTPINGHLGGASSPSYVKLDMALIDPVEQRNRAYTVLLLCDEAQSNVVATWGRREYRARQDHRSTFGTVDEGMRKFVETVRQKVRQQYFVTGLNGDVPMNRLHELLPHADDLQVVSRSLVRRLLRDGEFRQLFGQDGHLYTGTRSPMENDGGQQLALFEV